ncbi:hypothetical protein [Tateyamaria pelophila]|uniref:hypothetical protein n=1 Tax=Tateyamaria pelophila TaxID=328415 RepID=UPI001CBBA4A5|nr:hypothetical protein [Tateyamaria pelophila]
MSAPVRFELGQSAHPFVAPSVRWAYQDGAIELSFLARLEDAEFRFGKSGLAPVGVGKDSNIPVILALDYSPNPGLSISVFAGAAFRGELELEDASGNRVSKQDCDTAPLAGFAFRLRL